MDFNTLLILILILVVAIYIVIQCLKHRQIGISFFFGGLLFCVINYFLPMILEYLFGLIEDFVGIPGIIDANFSDDIFILNMKLGIALMSIGAIMIIIKCFSLIFNKSKDKKK